MFSNNLAQKSEHISLLLTINCFVVVGNCQNQYVFVFQEKLSNNMNKIIKSKEKKTLWEQFKNLIGKQNMEVNVIEIKKKLCFNCYQCIHLQLALCNMDPHCLNCIVGVMVSVLCLDSLLGQTKDYEIDIRCISVKHRSIKNKEQILVVLETEQCVRVERLVWSISKRTLSSSHRM